MFQSNGEFFISFGSDWFSELEPTDVAVSADNHLLIADCNNNYIAIYFYTGWSLCKEIWHTRIWYRDQLNGPFSLATDLNGFITVADSDNHCVTIFDKDGNNIYCFASYGSANGQFHYPDGIALSPSGSIYVSDTYNKGIQI